MLECSYQTLLERKFQIRKPIFLQNYLDFQFPPQNFFHQKFSNFRELNDQIIKIGLRTGFYRGRLFQRKDYEKANGKRVVYTCKERNCPAKQVYLWTGQDKILCEHFDNVHFHKKSSNLQKVKRQCIQQFILDMPHSENWENYQKWMYRFDICEKQAKYIVDQYYWYNNSEELIFTRLAFEGKTIRRIKDSDNNTVCVFIATESMKKNYHLFGEVINFDTTYRMIKKTNPYGGQYGVGYFLAQDTNMRYVLTGICMYAKDDKRLLKTIFDFYFDIVCQKRLPYAIYTEDLAPLNEALLELKKERGLKFAHLYDWFHVAENLKSQLKQQQNGKQYFYKFCQALGQPSIQKYNQILKQLEGRITTKGIVQDFMDKDQKYSVCKLPTTPLLLGILYKYSRSLNIRINTCTIFQTFAGRFFFTLLHFEKILQRLLEKVTVINQGLIKHIQYSEIHMLTIKVENLIMEKLVKYFVDSLNEDMALRPCSNDSLCYQVYFLKDQKSNENPKSRFVLRYSLQNLHWECSCRIQYLVGLPCCHIIKVLRQKIEGGSLEYYINTRWIHDKQDRIPQFSKPLISRKRRRV